MCRNIYRATYLYSTVIKHKTCLSFCVPRSISCLAMVCFFSSIDLGCFVSVFFWQIELEMVAAKGSSKV